MHILRSNAPSKLRFLQKQNEPFVLYMQGLSQLTANLPPRNSWTEKGDAERRDTPVYLAATLSGKPAPRRLWNAFVAGLAAMYGASYFAVKMARGDVPQNIWRHVYH